MDLLTPKEKELNHRVAMKVLKPVAKYFLCFWLNWNQKEILVKGMVDSLDDDEFQFFVQDCVRKGHSISASRKDSGRFKTAEEELNHLLTVIPRLEPYRVYFKNITETQRKKLGLPI
jgi:hypothetical protein